MPSNYIFVPGYMAELNKENIHGAVQWCIKNTLPFVFYRLPGKEDVHFVGEDPEGKITAAEAPGFMFNPMLRGEKTPAVFIRKDIHFVGRVEDLSSVRFTIDEVCGAEGNNIKATKEEYIEEVTKAVKAIKQGKLEKVVLSRIEKVTVPEKNPVVIFAELCKKYSSAFVSLVVIPDKTVWLTATPELLVSLEGEVVRSAAVAGTKPTSGNIKCTDKERVEQLMVADYIHAVLVNNCTDVVTKGPDEVVAGNVMHLKTEFSGHLNTGMYQILNELHPTPATCGLPKDKALEFILETEKHQRRYYTGYLGPCNIDGKTEWFVNLRCAELFSGRANLFIGGGITADSNPEKEWNETIMKAQTLLNVIAPTVRVV